MGILIEQFPYNISWVSNPFRTLRKVGNLFIVSLAISDLFVACLVMVFAVANDLQGSWIFGDQFCDIWVAFDVMCCTASILNLCAISMDR